MFGHQVLGHPDLPHIVLDYDKDAETLALKKVEFLRDRLVSPRNKEIQVTLEDVKPFLQKYINSAGSTFTPKTCPRPETIVEFIDDIDTYRENVRFSKLQVKPAGLERFVPRAFLDFSSVIAMYRPTPNPLFRASVFKVVREWHR